jgi:hypothetical protein
MIFGLRSRSGMNDEPEAAEHAATGGESRLLLPIVGLKLSGSWIVGSVTFHPASRAREMTSASGSAEPIALPAWVREETAATASEFDKWAVAEVTVPAIDEAISLVRRSVAVLRVVQHMENPRADIRRQAFGLPGQVGSARIDYISLSSGPATGWQRWGALAGWTFGDQSYQKWVTEPAYRFLDGALSCPDEERTDLQRRALIAVDVLNQAWSSWEPDVSLLNHAIALEVLLGEPRDREKKVRIARRVCYFDCRWPDCYSTGENPPCPYMTLHIRGRGQPGPELDRIIRGGRQQAYDDDIYCSEFFDLIELYDARNAILHDGKLNLTVDVEGAATWFIASRLLLPVLTWFAQHPDSDLSELDNEIARLPQWSK